jgi:hypothetical protein
VAESRCPCGRGGAALDCVLGPSLEWDSSVAAAVNASVASTERFVKIEWLSLVALLGGGEGWAAIECVLGGSLGGTTVLLLWMVPALGPTVPFQPFLLPPSGLRCC